MSETKPSSLSETMEKHTINMVKKLESQMPLHIKSFSDFSREYMKLLEEIYDIGYTIENKMFGNCGMDEKTIGMLDNYLDVGSKFFTFQMDISNQFFKEYLKMRLSVMESYNSFLHEFSKNINNNDTEKTDKEIKL
ncbi:MAG: hypothetical protein OEL69_03720 [Nitrosopumilus sp.]|nr:hypothetical protein [Nitrosopumilus sp.]